MTNARHFIETEANLNQT